MDDKARQLLQAEIMRARLTINELTKLVDDINADLVGVNTDLDEVSTKTDNAAALAKSAYDNANSAHALAEVAQEDAQTAITQTAILDRQKYAKPADGIPESDLTQNLQDKINAAGGGSQKMLYRHTICMCRNTIDFPSENSSNINFLIYTTIYNEDPTPITRDTFFDYIKENFNYNDITALNEVSGTWLEYGGIGLPITGYLVYDFTPDNYTFAVPVACLYQNYGTDDEPEDVIHLFFTWGTEKPNGDNVVAPLTYRRSDASEFFVFDFIKR